MPPYSVLREFSLKAACVNLLFTSGVLNGAKRQTLLACLHDSDSSLHTDKPIFRRTRSRLGGLLTFPFEAFLAILPCRSEQPRPHEGQARLHALHFACTDAQDLDFFPSRRMFMLRWQSHKRLGIA